MAEAVKREYEASLSDLTFNSKPLINMLTMLAEENVKHAQQIVGVIEARLQKAKPSEKLPVLYLMDSIIKNMKGSYLEAFTPNIVQTFCSVFEKVDEKTRQSLFKLRMTWSSYFPPKKLYAMDLKVKELDPAWPVVADPTAKQPAAIHVNPKFIKKTNAPQPAAAPASTSVQLTTEELAERKKKESERQEMEMRQQLIKKQEQLLQLQQKRLEFELQQTQSKLEEQALELKQKNEQLLLQQQALQQQQVVAQQQQVVAQQQQVSAATAAWPRAMPAPPQPPLMWPPRPPMFPGNSGPPMMPGPDPVMPIPDPMMPMHSQQPGFLPPPPMPPFNINQSMPMQQQQQQPPPMQPVLPMQQVPPAQQVTQAASVNRDPRIARDPRLARRDPRLRGVVDPPTAVPASTAQTPLAVATVPPVQSAATASVAQPRATPTTSNKISPAMTQQLKSVVTVAPSLPSVKPTPKSPTKGGDAVNDNKARDTKQQSDQKRDSKPEVKSSVQKDTKSETKPQETKVPDLKSDPKPKVEGTAKQSKETKAIERSPRRTSDEKRDTRSDNKSRDRTSREPERRTSRDTKKEFDKKDSWSGRERDRDSRERERDYRDRLKERIGGTRETSRLASSRRRSNRSRSRSRSPVPRSRSPRGSDKGRTTTPRGTKVDKFGRDLPRPTKETKEEKKPESVPENRKTEKKTVPVPENRKTEKKPEPASDNHKKDVDDRIKPRPSSKENLPDIKDENKQNQGKSEKRRSSSPSKESDKESETKEEAPSKRPRLDEEVSLGEPERPPSKKEPEQKNQENLSEETPHQEDGIKEPPRPKGPRPLMELPPPRPMVDPYSWSRERHFQDNLENERRMFSPGGRRLLPRRRLSIDPNVHIPKELSLEKHAFILEQAEKQLHSGELSHEQHQELLRELFELHQLQRQQQDDQFEQLHPHDLYIRRHYPDDPIRCYDPKLHVDSIGIDSWPREKDIDHRRFPTQDVDMRVFDPGHPMHAATAKSRGEDPLKSVAKPGAHEQLSLPSADQDERTRNRVHKDRDDRVKATPTENQNVLPPPPLKSILKPRKAVLLDSPLSPEPAEKHGNDSKVKTVGEAIVETKEKEENLSEKQDKPETVEDEKASLVSDVTEDATHPGEGDTTVAMEVGDVVKTMGKKKNKKKKKKGKGTEAEVHVEVTAFEENLEIKPPVFNEKTVQPLMDMDERRNSTDNEPPNVLPAPFREADDLEELFPAGRDRDERRGPGHQLQERGGSQSRDGPPLEGPQREGPYEEGLPQDCPSMSDQIKEGHPRDPRLRKGPLINVAPRDNPPRQGPVQGGLLGDFSGKDTYRDTLPRNLPYRGRHPNESLPREGPFRHVPPREDPFRDGPPREGILREDPPRNHQLRGSPPREVPFRDDSRRELQLQGGPRDGPFRDGPPRGGPFRDDPIRERPYRDGPQIEGQFRDGPQGWGPYKDSRPTDGYFRGHTREGSFRDGQPREGPFREGHPREGPFRGGPPREGPVRDGQLIEGHFRDGPPREGPFRDGPPRESPFRDGTSREGAPYRDGPPRDGTFHGDTPREGPFRDGQIREGPFRDGPLREGPSRGSPPREDGYFRGGPQRNGPYRGMPHHEGPFREGPLREGPPVEGPLRDGPSREGPFRDVPPREALIRRSPPRDGSLRPLPRDGPSREVEKHWDPRRGSPDSREERFPVPPNELRPRSLMGIPSGQISSPVERVEVPRTDEPVMDEPGKPPGMADRDERQPQHLDQRVPDHLLPPQPIQLPMEMQDKPPTTMEHTVPLPHPQAKHPLPMNQLLNLPPGLRMPNIAMLPLQVLTEQAKANLQRAANLQVSRLPGPGFLPSRSMFQGAGLPLRATMANFLNIRQPGPVLALAGQQRQLLLPGIPPILQQFPGGIRHLVRPELQGHSQFDPRGFPGPLGPLPGQMAAPEMSNPALMGAPHLIRPENSQGTPPLQQPAPLDINSLFAKLVGAGILPPTRSDSPVVPGTGTPPPTGAKEEPGPPEPGSDEDLFVPELGLYPEELKCRYEGVINRIYTGTQCSSCGMRFVIDEMDRYRKHLDWHFRQNRRDKDGVKAVQNRKWFYEVNQWLDFEEINEIEEERSNFFEEMELQARTDKDGVHCVAIDATIEGDEMCSLCHEPFEQFFDEDEEVWKLRDAVRFNKRSYHPGCYEDAKDASLLETPTPGEEGLNSSFDATVSPLSVSPLSAYSQLHASRTLQPQSTEQLVDPQKDNTNQPSAPTTVQLQSADLKKDSQIDLSTSTVPHQSTSRPVDPPNDSQNQQNISTTLEPTSIDQAVDPQKDIKIQPSLSATVQSTDQVVDAQNNSQPSADASVVKAETSNTDDSKPSTNVKEEVDQQMEIASEAELTIPMKEEETDAHVKTEPVVDPQVKMEVESNVSEADNQPQDSVTEEKMEVDDPHPVKLETSTLDNVQPMETTSEPVPSTEGVIKKEPVDNSNIQLETGPEITASAPVNSEVDPVAEQTPSKLIPGLTLSSDPSPTRPGAVQDGNQTEPAEVVPTETKPSETEPSELTPAETEPSELTPAETEPSCETIPKDKLEDTTVAAAQSAPEAEGAVEQQSGVAVSNTQQSPSETETASSSQPAAEETQSDTKESVESETKCEVKSETDTDKPKETETETPASASGVRNIQPISVIGRTRMDPQWRRDMFFM